MTATCELLILAGRLFNSTVWVEIDVTSCLGHPKFEASQVVACICVYDVHELCVILREVAHEIFESWTGGAEDTERLIVRKQV